MEVPRSLPFRPISNISFLCFASDFESDDDVLQADVAGAAASACDEHFAAAMANVSLVSLKLLFWVLSV